MMTNSCNGGAYFIRIFRSNIICIIGLLFGAMFLAACQTTSLAPEVAASISLSLESGKIVPPPRKSDDMARLLYASKAPLKTDFIKRRADEEPPVQEKTSENAQESQDEFDFPEDFNAKLYNFYLSRGKAAEIMGRLGQRISDYEKAVELIVKGLGANEKSEILARATSRLAWAYEGLGEFEKAASTMLQSLKAVPATRSTETGWDFEVYRYANIAFFNSWLGDYDAAESYIKRARAALNIHKGQSYRELEWNELSEAEILRSEGRLAQSRGEYKKAEQYYSNRVRLYEKYNQIMDRAFARFHLSEALLEQAKFVEAETQARKGLSEILEVGGSTFPSTGYLVYGLSNILLATGRSDEARLLAETALQIFSESAPLDDKSLPVGSLRFILMMSAIMAEDWPTAIEQANRLIKYHGAMDASLMKAEPEAALVLSFVQLKDKKFSEALTRANIAKTLLINREGPNSRGVIAAVGLQAAILERMGRDNEALIKFRTIRPALTGIGLSSDVNLTGLDNHARAKYWEVLSNSYLRLLQRVNQDQLGDISVIEESFLVTQMLDGSTTDKALAASSARSIGEDTGLGGLIRALQDLQVKRKAVLKALNYNLSLPADNRDDNLIAGLQLFVSDSEREITEFQSRISSEFPKYKKNP